jgi:hypothetical protein
MHSENTRAGQLHIRVSESELARARAVAVMSGKPLSSLLRGLIEAEHQRLRREARSKR